MAALSAWARHAGARCGALPPSSDPPPPPPAPLGSWRQSWGRTCAPRRAGHGRGEGGGRAAAPAEGVGRHLCCRGGARAPAGAARVPTALGGPRRSGVRPRCAGLHSCRAHARAGAAHHHSSEHDSARGGLGEVGGGAGRGVARWAPRARARAGLGRQGAVALAHTRRVKSSSSTGGEAGRARPPTAPTPHPHQRAPAARARRGLPRRPRVLGSGARAGRRAGEEREARVGERAQPPPFSSSPRPTSPPSL